MSTPRTFGDLDPSQYPGERLGMPETGIGSVGRFGRRIGALVVDYVLALAVANVFLPYSSSANSLLTLALFVFMQVLGILFIGGGAGHRLFGMRLLAIDGTPVGFRKALLRSLLLVVVIPALVWDSDQRGFHDKVAGTVLTVVR
ncbi:MAG TPA: RDD family protein [Microbacteriaceae bacterium]|nr:RDD family protein [Microbacteriaceae bacterium]